MKSLTVTGASGYLGGRLVQYAVGKSDMNVRSVVRRPTPWLPGDVARIEDFARDSDTAVSGSDFVIHLAGANEVSASTDPDESIRNTVTAARAVAEACDRSSVTRLVYVSTVHVYGGSLLPGEVVDERTPAQPRSPYAAARLEAEKSIQASAGGTEAVIVRLTNGVGAPPDPSVNRWSLVGNDLCRQVACGEPITLRSSGQQWRDFVALSDVVEILLAVACESTIPPGTYNLASGEPTTIRQFAELVGKVAEKSGLGQPELLIPQPESNAPEPYRVSTNKLSALGYRATTPLSDAVAETLAFCWKHRQRICRADESLS